MQRVIRTYHRLRLRLHLHLHSLAVLVSCSAVLLAGLIRLGRLAKRNVNFLRLRKILQRRQSFV